MAKKKKPGLTAELRKDDAGQPGETIETVPIEITPREEPQAPEVNLNQMIRVVNIGAPFPCDLSPWGYGQRWPKNAVYTIPMSAYLDCLKRGLNGRQA